MTLDELENIYIESGGTGDGTTRAGIRAVVEALRPAFRSTNCGICLSNEMSFNEILASDGEVKAAR